MFRSLAGLTAIEVSLWGPAVDSQSVLTFAAFVVGAVQIAVPVLTAGAVPKTAFVTGAGAPVTLWAKSIGWTSPSSFGTAAHTDAPLSPSPTRPAAATHEARRKRMCLDFILFPFPRSGSRA